MYVFEYFGNGTWSQIGQEIGSDIFVDNRYEEFYNIGMSGDGSTVAGNFDNAGGYGFDDIIVIFKYQNNSWTQVGQSINRTWDNDLLPMSFNHDGTRIAVGDYAGDDEKGSVRVYQLKNDSWIQIGQTLTGLNEEDLLKDIDQVLNYANSLSSLDNSIILTS